MGTFPCPKLDRWKRAYRCCWLGKVFRLIRILFSTKESPIGNVRHGKHAWSIRSGRTYFIRSFLVSPEVVLHYAKFTFLLFEEPIPHSLFLILSWFDLNIILRLYLPIVWELWSVALLSPLSSWLAPWIENQCLNRTRLQFSGPSPMHRMLPTITLISRQKKY